MSKRIVNIPQHISFAGHIIDLVNKGYSDAEIGRRMGISRQAVRYYRLRYPLIHTLILDKEMTKNKIEA